MEVGPTFYYLKIKKNCQRLWGFRKLFNKRQTYIWMIFGTYPFYTSCKILDPSYLATLA